jgi:hypothetical protein
VSEHGYTLWYPDGEDVQLYGRQTLVLPLEKNDRQVVELTLPNGTTQFITNYEQKK